MAEAGVYPLERMRAVHRNYQRGGRHALALRLLHAAYDGARVRPAATRADRLRRPQPGDRQRVRRGAPGVVPQRADLLRPRSCRTAPSGLFRERSCTAASSASAPRRSLQFAAHAAGASSPWSPQKRHLPQARMSSRRCSTRPRDADAVVIGASAGGVEALLQSARGAAGRASRRRCSSCCTCRAGRPSGWPRCSAGAARCRCARRWTSSRSSRARLVRAARLPPAGRARPHASRCRCDPPVHYSRPAIDAAVRVGRARLRRAPARHRADRRQRRRRRRPGGDARRAAGMPWCRTRRSRGAAMPQAALALRRRRRSAVARRDRAGALRAAGRS